MPESTRNSHPLADEALADAKRGVTRAQRWRAANAQYGANSREAAKERGEMHMVLCRMEVYQNRHAPRRPSELLRAECPHLADAVENLATAVEGAMGIALQSGPHSLPPKSWAWIDDLQQAVKALEEAIEVPVFDPGLYLTTEECIRLAEGRAKSLRRSTITKHKESFSSRIVDGRLFIEPTSFLRWLNTYNPQQRARTKGPG
jgi:hypothetical protein